MNETRIFRDCNFHGVECTCNGEFRRLRNGKYVACGVLKRTLENGRRQTAYIRVMDGKKSYYHAANALVAYAWCKGYEEGDYIVHKDGNLHNICSDNLRVCGKNDYTENKLRNSKNKVCLEDRIRKLEIIKEETEATLDLFRNNRWDRIHRHVERYLVNCLMDYGTRTIHLAKSTCREQVPEIIIRLYECLDRGYCVYNYERWCKYMLLEYKKNGSFGNKANVPSKNIRMIVPKDKIDELCNKFNVKPNKKAYDV